MPDAYFLDESDRDIFREMAVWFRQMKSERNRILQPNFGQQASDTLVAYVPAAGITGVAVVAGTGTGTDDDDTVSSATCDIYRIVEQDWGNKLEPIPDLTKTVYNVASSDVAGSNYVTIGKTKAGRWVVLQSGVGGYKRYITFSLDAELTQAADSVAGSIEEQWGSDTETTNDASTVSLKNPVSSTPASYIFSAAPGVHGIAGWIGDDDYLILNMHCTS
jgi:hypothetical protein